MDSQQRKYALRRIEEIAATKKAKLQLERNAVSTADSVVWEAVKAGKLKLKSVDALRQAIAEHIRSETRYHNQREIPVVSLFDTQTRLAAAEQLRTDELQVIDEKLWKVASTAQQLKDRIALGTDAEALEAIREMESL
jgi:hypothetical protein